MMSALSNSIRRTAARLSPDPTPDGELLSRFLTSSDEAAFAVLVRRHGKMVFGACRRVLGNAADADDAFQAAFVVLVRKAHSLTGRVSVGDFLYATAVLTARKARTMATRRRANEAKAVHPESVDPPGADDEATGMLDEELAGLPAKYREPVVLCELEGVSRKEAAARLGIPEGTISSRLTTAHRMLAKRLTARGFAAVAVTAVLGTQAFAVPDALAVAAVRAAADGRPAGVTQLVSEVTKILLWNKLRAGVAVLAGVLLLLSVGGGMVRRGVAADDMPGVNAPVPEKKAEPKDEDLLQGSWQAVAAESDGKKAPDEAVKAVLLRFKGTEATFPGNLMMTFALDPKSQPKGLTLTPTAGPNKVMKVESAIYELTGDDLKVCVDWGRDGNAGTRPKDFTTAPRDGRISLNLKRVKGEKKDEPQAPDDAKRILGKWVQTSSAAVPNDNTVDPLARQTLTFDETVLHTEHWINEGSERRTTDCRYELNPTARPKELTLIGKESKSQWIYELDGDKLKMAVLDDGTRPASFDPREIPKGRAMKVTAFAREKVEPKKEAKKADEPTWKAEFRKAYGLKDGELVRRVAPPYADCRAEYFRDSFERLRKRRPTEAELNDEVSTFTQFNSKDGIASTGWQTRSAPDDGVTLQFLLSTVAGHSRTRIESDETSLQQKVTGDFITRTGADPEKLTAQLNEILRKELELPVKLSFQDIEEEVFVLSGKYEAKPLEDRKANEAEVHAVRLIDRTIGGGGSGTFREMTDTVERHVNRPIVLEKIDGQPKRVVWHFNFDKPPTPPIEAQERDAETLLANIAAQTGLTVKTEKRKVRKLVVEHSEVKK